MRGLYRAREVTALAGVSARTLRHYADIGLLPPTDTAAGGERCYDAAALVRLQRILLLRGLGVSLAQIGEILDQRTDPVVALEHHLDELGAERRRLDRQIAAVRRTRDALQNGADPVSDTMFDGFDHEQYQEEVSERWGAKAWRDSDHWWRSLDEAGRDEVGTRSAELTADWRAAADAGLDIDGPEVRALVARQLAWLTQFPGTPGHRGDAADLAAYAEGLGEMYVADPRFGVNYGGPAGAAYVRDALVRWAREVARQQ